jgi:predicted Zn-dependent protease with MMP-like domain
MRFAAIGLLDEAWAALDSGKLTRVRSLARRALRDSNEALRAEACHLLGLVALDSDELNQALSFLHKALGPHYDTADLHYDLGVVHELKGNEEERLVEFLKVWDMDSALDREHLLEEERLVELAEQTLLELPPRMVELLQNAPIFVEERPDRYLVEEGLDPRLLGLFEGPSWSEQGLSGPQLARILLYRTNIEATCRNIGEAERQVRITLLHETAHFFGLNEEELQMLGLG